MPASRKSLGIEGHWDCRGKEDEAGQNNKSKLKFLEYLEFLNFLNFYNFLEDEAGLNNKGGLIFF